MRFAVSTETGRMLIVPCCIRFERRPCAESNCISPIAGSAASILTTRFLNLSTFSAEDAGKAHLAAEA